MAKQTKVVTGVNYGDVQNIAIRNILTSISREIEGRINEQKMNEISEFFEQKCPYTGKDLKPGEYVADHIIPQNKKHCGLNVIGNLVYVDKEANSKKHDRTAEVFLLDDSLAFWEGVPRSIREQRLEKIKEYQRKYDYDAEKLTGIIRPLLEKMYNDVRKEQENRINEILLALNMHPLRSEVDSVKLEKELWALNDLDPDFFTNYSEYIENGEIQAIEMAEAVLTDYEDCDDPDIVKVLDNIFKLLN